jgi:hypothetical protein
MLRLVERDHGWIVLEHLLERYFEQTAEIARTRQRIGVVLEEAPAIRDCVAELTALLDEAHCEAGPVLRCLLGRD